LNTFAKWSTTALLIGGLALGLALILLFVPGGLGYPSSWKGTTSYPGDLYGYSCASSTEFIYCVGGASAATNTTGTLTDAVYYAAPLSSGGIQSWSRATDYPNNRVGQSCVVAGVDLYCVGGIITNAVYYAAILPSGNLSSWNATTSYPISISGQSCVASTGYL
jgi:hypothetical protein